jgi:hypothetical protein
MLTSNMPGSVYILDNLRNALGTGGFYNAFFGSPARARWCEGAKSTYRIRCIGDIRVA